MPAIKGGLPGGVKLLGAGSAQKTLVDRRLSATPDGLIVGLERDALANYGIDDIGSDCVAFEIKPIDPRGNVHEEKASTEGRPRYRCA